MIHSRRLANVDSGGTSTYAKGQPHIGSRYPFLLYGGLGAVILTALDYALFPVLAKMLVSAGPAGVSKEFVPIFSVACLIGVGPPVIAGLLAARSSGFTFVGALAGALVYVGYDILRLIFDPVVAQHTTAPIDPTSLSAIGCQGVLGFFFGLLGGLVGRHFYQEPPSYQGTWAPSPYGSYEPGAYTGPPPPSGPYGAPPTYGASDSSAPYAPYAPPQYQPPRYQPGASLPPSAYPAPGYAPPTDEDGRSGPAPGASSMPWNQGWPAAGEGEPPNEDASGRSWYGWPPPPR